MMLIEQVRKFLRDEDGQAGIEFLMASPLLFGVMVFTAEYGEALRVRSALDAAVQDATRYVARVEAINGQSEDGSASLQITSAAEATARAMIQERTGREIFDGSSRVGFQVRTELIDDGNFKTAFHVVEIEATILMEMPFLSFLNIGRASDDPRVATAIPISSIDQARYLSPVPSDSTPCSEIDRRTGLC